MLVWLQLFVIGSTSALYVPKTHEVSHLPLDPPHVLTKRSFDQHLRFSIFYSSAVDGLDSSKRSLIKERLVPDATNYWRQVLRVKETTSPILLNRDCINGRYFINNGQPRYCERPVLNSGCAASTVCGTVSVPEEHLQACYSCNVNGRSCQKEIGSTEGTGVSGADYVLYVSSEQTGLCGSGGTSAENVAYAGHCQQEQALDRPVVGFINLCPDLLSSAVEDYNKQLATVKHEILHALGFTSSLYAFYRNSNGEPRTSRDSNNLPDLGRLSSGIYQWSSSTIISVTRQQWKVSTGNIAHSVHIIVTPRVKQVVRDYFNCDSLEGAELENQGGIATELSHWEKRVFENEAMTGTFTQNPVFSNVTFALMEDTGWYLPDYSLAQVLEWGKDLGCDFAKGSCGGWMDDKRSTGLDLYPFCETLKTKTPLPLKCTVDRLAVALCNLVEYQTVLDTDYQYFSSIAGEDITADNAVKYGGVVTLADYCPYHQEFVWTSSGVAVRGSQCRYAENNPAFESNLALESYGPSSVCVRQGSSWTRESGGRKVTAINWGSGCYKVSCSEPDAYLSIYINGQRYPCRQEGETITVTQDACGETYSGTLICPEKQDACWGVEEITRKATGKSITCGDGNGGMSLSVSATVWYCVLLAVVYSLSM